jgi:hypothetical protein
VARQQSKAPPSAPKTPAEIQAALDAQFTASGLPTSPAQPNNVQAPTLPGDTVQTLADRQHVLNQGLAAASAPGALTGEMTDSQVSKPAETKAQRFRRLLSRRLTNAVRAIEVIAPLSNKHQYEYTDAQVEFLETKLREVCIATLLQFQGKQKTTGTLIEVP